MATALLKKVDEFLTCTICTDMYTDLCTLYCQHTFCRKCITKYTKTRLEALQSKTVPCPSCRQVSKVPNPSRPVEEWAWQIKPSFVILGLIDTSEPGPTTTEGSAVGRCCNVCEHLGEITSATSWCPECEVALCDRCTKTHHANPASRDHAICDLSAEVKVRRRCKVMCREHKKNCIEFHCKDCKKSACQKCCILYHRACKLVVDIESMRQELTSDLLKKRDFLSKHLKRKLANVIQKKGDFNKASQNKMNIKAQIQSVSQKAIDKLKQKEKKLIDKLDEVTEKQMSQLQADVKLEEIDIQMYRQHCEFIDQAVTSECVLDMYDMYVACESGTSVLVEIRTTDTTISHQIKDICFSQYSGNRIRTLDGFQLGKIDVAYEEGSGALSSPVLCNTINTRTENDKMNPGIVDITVLVIDDVHTVIITDYHNNSLKSFCIRNKTCNNTLPFKEGPWGISPTKENQVMVAIPGSNQIATVNVTPDLVLFSTIKTSKSYYTLAVISPSSLAAGTWFPDNNVDILNTAGQVIKSVSTHNNACLFNTIWSMCVDKKGNILALDFGNKKVTCLTSGGYVQWQQTFGDCMGMTTNCHNDILLAILDSKKVIQ